MTDLTKTPSKQIRKPKDPSTKARCVHVPKDLDWELEIEATAAGFRSVPHLIVAVLVERSKARKLTKTAQDQKTA
jgi:hypothetical protein